MIVDGALSSDPPFGRVGSTLRLQKALKGKSGAIGHPFQLQVAILAGLLK